MLCLRLGFFLAVCVGIQVYAKGNTQSGAFIGVVLETLVILLGDILAITAADDHAVNMGLDLFPVDFALPGGNIDHELFHGITSFLE